MNPLRFLLTGLLLFSCSVSAALQSVGFVPYNTTNKHTIGGIVYTNGTFTGNGSGLTNLNASALASGTINTNRLPGVALLAGGNTWTNSQSVGLAPSDTFVISTNGSVSGGMMFSNGCVVIGSSAPATYRLNVSGSSQFSGTVFGNLVGSVSSPAFALWYSTTGLFIKDSNAGSLGITARGKEGLTVQTNGVVTFPVGTTLLSSALPTAVSIRQSNCYHLFFYTNALMGMKVLSDGTTTYKILD